LAEKEIIIRQGQVSLWKRIYVATILTFIVYLFYLYFTNEPIAYTNYYIVSFGHLIEISIYIIVPTVALIISTNYHFNFEKKQYKIEKTFGRIQFGKWKVLPELEYISVFKKKDYFQVNLWYYKNNHFNVYNLLEYDDAIEVGVEIAEKLKIDVLDATSHHDYQWLDKNAYKKSGVIQYLK